MTIESREIEVAVRNVLKSVFGDAIAYWEKRRIIYNLALVFPTLLGYLGVQEVSAAIGDNTSHHPVDAFLIYGFAVIGANIAYCAVYPVDITMGYADLGDRKRTTRTFMFAGGTIFACVLSWRASQLIVLYLTGQLIIKM